MRTKGQGQEAVRHLVMVKMTISAWYGRATDDGLSREVEQNKGADTGSMGVVVSLLPKMIAHELGCAVSQLRGKWNERTLPWEDGGWRVVRADRYMALMESVQEYRDALQSATDKIVSTYDQILVEQKDKLNGAFNPDLYPSRSQLEEKFGVYFSSRAIVPAGDMRIEGLPEDQMKSIRNAVQEEYKAQIQTAVNSIIGKVRKLAEDMITRLTKKEQKGTRYTGLIELTKRTVESLKELNILGDPKIEELLNTAEAKLTEYDADSIRTDKKVRRLVEENAKAVLSELDTFGME